MRGRRVEYFVVIFFLACFAVAPSLFAQDRIRLTGSGGGSFPFPLYGQWFKDYSKAHGDVILDYQAKGSGAGIRDFINKTVDFAASDAAMTDEEMAQVKDGVQLLPMTAGTIVLAVNLLGSPKELKLFREAYPKIFVGEITKWNDPAIAKANPGATLPASGFPARKFNPSKGASR